MGSFRWFFACLTAVTLLLSMGTTVAHADEVELRISLNAPDGVPAVVELSGPSTIVVGKGADVSSTSVDVTVEVGAYGVRAEPIVWEGKRYVPSPDTPDTVSPSASDVLTFDWVLSTGVQDFIVSELEPTRTAFQWTTGSTDSNVTVRRSEGVTPPETETQGTAVPVNGDTATDETVSAGETYTYAIFEDSVRAFTLTLGTSDPSDLASESFVRDYSSVYFDSTPEWESVAETLLRVDWPASAGLPLPGAGVVVPRSDSLPGGFVGIIDGVSIDGNQVDLAPAGLADVLAYWNVELEDLSGLEFLVLPDAGEGVTPTPSPSPSPSPTTSASPTIPAPTTVAPTPTGQPEPRPAPSVTGPPPRPGLPSTGARGLPLNATTSAGSGAGASVSVGCLAVSEGVSQSDFRLGFKPTGHFYSGISQYGFLGIPTGVEIDVYAGVAASAAMDLETSREISCSQDVGKLMLPLPIPSGIPFSILVEPSVGITVSGTTKVENVGAAATIGLGAVAEFTLGGVESFEPVAVATLEPLTSTVSKSASLDIDVTLQGTFGPGVGNTGVGAIAGLTFSVSVVPFSATEIVAQDSQFSSCMTVGGRVDATAGLTAKAWAGPFGASASWNVFEGTLFERAYGAMPKGCDLPGISDDVIGEGVIVDNSQSSGSPEQWGRVEGFVPGENTWVLSTGLVAETLGEPHEFASTDLMGAGDERLTALAGYMTYDAVTYSARIIPAGPTLNVKYAFATEEYPEYVGSSYNDVMAIFIDGVNCAVVPGTDDPVSVNTINNVVNSEYFIDNTYGAAGYNTVMNGVTAPLTCSVPVEPGKAVDLVIALADSSDGVYDSAVALVDKGIWSE